MSAYNWIIVSSKCPACFKQAEFRCQTHVAADYDGDSNGPFHDKEYNLEQIMRWWPQDHQKYSFWRVNGRKQQPTDTGTDYECCYTTCPKCSKQLYAIIQFEGARATRLLDIGLEEKWPEDYWK